MHYFGSYRGMNSTEENQRLKQLLSRSESVMHKSAQELNYHKERIVSPAYSFYFVFVHALASPPVLLAPCFCLLSASCFQHAVSFVVSVELTIFRVHVAPLSGKLRERSDTGGIHVTRFGSRGGSPPETPHSGPITNSKIRYGRSLSFYISRSDAYHPFSLRTVSA